MLLENPRIPLPSALGTISGAPSHNFSQADQTIASLSQAFTIMDQNRDGFIDKNDLRDTFAALGTSPRTTTQHQLGRSSYPTPERGRR